MDHIRTTFSNLSFFQKIQIPALSYWYIIEWWRLLIPKMNPKHKPKTANLGVTKISRPKKRPIPSASTKKPASRTCQISGCFKESLHTLSILEYEPTIKKIGLSIRKEKGARRFNICKEHYKKMKKVKKKDEKLIKPQFSPGESKVPKRDKISNYFE